MWKTFCYLYRASSIKTDLQTCNLRTSQFISYKSENQFWLNLPSPNGKMFPRWNVKINYIWKWMISFAISTFVIVEEMPSVFRSKCMKVSQPKKKQKFLTFDSLVPSCCSTHQYHNGLFCNNSNQVGLFLDVQLAER